MSLVACNMLQYLFLASQNGLIFSYENRINHPNTSDRLGETLAKLEKDDIPYIIDTLIRIHFEGVWKDTEKGTTNAERTHLMTTYSDFFEIFQGH